MRGIEHEGHGSGGHILMGVETITHQNNDGRLRLSTHARQSSAGIELPKAALPWGASLASPNSLVLLEHIPHLVEALRCGSAVARHFIRAATNADRD